MNLFGRWRRKKKESEDKVKKVIYTEKLSDEPKEYENEDTRLMGDLLNDYLENNSDSLKELQEQMEKFEQLEKLVRGREWYDENWLGSNSLWGDEAEERKVPLHEKLGVHNMAVIAVKQFLNDPSNQMLLNNNSWYELIVRWCNYVGNGDYEYLPVYREDLVKVLEASGIEIDYSEVVRAYKDYR